MRGYYAISRELAEVPRDGATVLVDNWWMAHPEHGLLVYASGRGLSRFWSPACNRDRRVTAHRGLLKPGMDVVQVPAVYFLTHHDGYRFDESLNPVEITDQMLADLAYWATEESRS